MFDRKLTTMTKSCVTAGCLLAFAGGCAVDSDDEVDTRVLTDTQDRLELGLYDADGQTLAILRWGDHTQTAVVSVDADAGEQTIPLSVTSPLGPEERVDLLTDGLLASWWAANAPGDEVVQPATEQLAAERSNAAGWTYVTPALDVSPGGGPVQSDLTRVMIGGPGYKFPDSDEYLWLNVGATIKQDNLLSGKRIGLVLANGPGHSFEFTIPEDYDLDEDDLDTADSCCGGGLFTRQYSAILSDQDSQITVGNWRDAWAWL